MTVCRVREVEEEEPAASSSGGAWCSEQRKKMDEKINSSNLSSNLRADEEVTEGTDGKDEGGLEVEAAENMSRGGTDCNATRATTRAGLEAAAAAAGGGGEGPAAGVSTEEIDSNSLVHKTSSSSSSSRSPAVISRSSISSGSRLSTNRPQMQSTSSEVCRVMGVVQINMSAGSKGGTSIAVFAFISSYSFREQG